MTKTDEIPPPTSAERLRWYDDVLASLTPDLADKFVAVCVHMTETGAYGEIGIVFERGKPKRIKVSETYEP